MADPSGLRTDAPHFDHLVALMARLRQECAWKAEQTHLSLVRFVIEEAYEVVDALETGTAAELQEELGDLLLQVIFHAVIAEQNHQFDIDDVISGLIDKLIRRNPHVFGDNKLTDPAAIDAQWEAIKASEGPAELDPFAHIPAHLPALMRAVAVAEKLSISADTIDHLGASGQIGDQLLMMALRADQAGLDPEQELRAAIERLIER